MGCNLHDYVTFDPAAKAKWRLPTPLLISCPCLQVRALTVLQELLRAEEAALVGRQKASEATAHDHLLPSTSSSAVHEARGLATANGRDDTSSLSSSMLQQLWDKVRAGNGRCRAPCGMNTQTYISLYHHLVSIYKL